MDKLTKKEKRELAKEEKAKERQKDKTQSGFKKFLLYVLLLAAVGYFGYKVYQFFTAPLPEVAKEPVNVVDSDWVKGSEEYKATLIEYGDFQCPACGSFYPIVKKLLEENDGLRVVYRHFPLSSHKNAFPAALAAEAAGDQGKFWEMHDILFERQNDWSNLGNPKDKFVEYAKELGLDVNQFEDYYESEDAKDNVNADMLSGNKLGVNATPTFYLNGQKLQSIASFDDFSKKIEQAINNESSSN